MSKKLESIKLLRGIAILLVMLFHLRIIEEKYGAGLIFPPSPALGFGGLDFFLVISGFITIIVTKGKEYSFQYVKEFLYTRLTRIYPLYWLYSLPVLIVFTFAPTWVNSAQGNKVDMLASFLLLPSHLLPLLNIGWSLVHQVYFYLAFAFFLAFLRVDQLPKALLAWIILSILGEVAILFTDLEKNATFALIVNPLNYEFIFGCLAAYYISNIKTLRIGQYILFFGIALYITMFMTLTFAFPPTTKDWEWLRVIVYGIPAVLIVSGLVSIERTTGKFPDGLLGKLGDWSFSIYLSHIPLMTLLGRIWSYFFTPSFFGNITFLVGVLISVVIFGWLSYEWIETPWLKKLSLIKNRLFPKASSK